MEGRGVFITGTDTGVGKTWVAEALIQSLRRTGAKVAGMKPVATGCDSQGGGWRSDDALRLLRASSIRLDYEAVNPYAFAPPVSPNVAAQLAGRPIDLERIRACYRTLVVLSDWVIVEGVGGWEVPLTGRERVSHLAQALELPVILVVGLRLGCVNHALLTEAAIERSGVHYWGWIANHGDAEWRHAGAHLDTLRALLRGPCLGVIPALPAQGCERGDEGRFPPVMDHIRNAILLRGSA